MGRALVACVIVLGGVPLASGRVVADEDEVTTPVPAIAADAEAELEMVPVEWAWDVFSEAGARQEWQSASSGRSLGDLAIGATVRYVPAVGCTVLEARQDLHWYLRGDRRAFAPDGSMEVCLERAHLVEDVWLPTVTAGYRLRVDALPALDQPRTLARDVYSHYGVHFDVGLLDSELQRGRLKGLMLGVRADVLLQGAEASAANPSQGLLTLSFLATRYGWSAADGQVVDVGQVTGRLEGGRDPSRIIDLSPVAIRAWPVGRITFDAAAAYSVARGGDASRRTPTGRLAGSVTSVVGLASLEYERGFLAATDEALILEDRLTARLTSGRAGHSLELAGFVARTSFVAGVPADEPGAVTAGGSLTYQQALGRFVTSKTSAELGRSYFAILGPMAGERPSFGINVSTWLTLHYGR